VNVELQAAELLEQGAKILERDGWMTRLLHDDVSGKRCVMGGLLAAAGVEPKLFAGVSWVERDHVAATAVARLASVVDPDPVSQEVWKPSDWNRVAIWNNMPSRTQQQVLDAVQVAAMSLRLQTAAPQPLLRKEAEVSAA